MTALVIALNRPLPICVLYSQVCLICGPTLGLELAFGALVVVRLCRLWFAVYVYVLAVSPQMLSLGETLMTSPYSTDIWY